jgi:hypothetical protein
MECIGKLKDVSRDWMTNQYNITFTVEPSVINSIDSIKDCEKLSIKAVKYRKKRSLDANALLWSCLGQIASSLQADKWDIYLQMLKRYGKYTYICVKPNMVDSVRSQWRETEVIGEVNINGTEAVQMLCYFGSSTYNTQEYSVLLDGVISEMQEMGLETPPSQEMKRALEEWERKMQGEKHNSK